MKWTLRILPMLVSAALMIPTASHAAQQQWGASYLDWTGTVLSNNSSMSQIIQPLEISPYTYWEAGWHWDNVADGGYGGIQSQGILANGILSDLAIFSIWNGLSAVPGPGAGCRPFGGEGIGYTCSTSINLVAGNKYRITFGVDSSRGPQWWNAYIEDLAKGTSTLIGTIESTSSVAKATNWNNFIEYWGQSVPCDAVGPASAKFYTPISNNVDVEVSSPVFSRPAKPCVMSAGDTPPPGFIGDAIIRFGGPSQAPSTQSMPYTKTKAQLAADAKAAADKAAADKAAADKAAADKAAADKAAADKAAADKAAADALAADALAAKQATDAKAAADKAVADALAVKAKQAAAAVKKVTIVCIKGKLIKSVTGIKPVCPTGYTRK